MPARGWQPRGGSKEPASECCVYESMAPKKYCALRIHSFTRIVANLNISIEEMLSKISEGEKLVFKPTKLLSSKAGYLELSEFGFRLVQGNLGIKNEESYEWAAVKEFGVNKFRNTGKLSFFVSYEHNIMVGFNLRESKQKRIHKFGSTMGKFMKCIGQDQQQFMHGALQDQYGFKPDELAELLNSCIARFSSR